MKYFSSKNIALETHFSLMALIAFWERNLHFPERGKFCLLLFYVRATVFQLYHGGDIMCELRRRKPEPTHLPTQGISNVPHQIDMVWEELAFGDAVSYTQRRNG